METDTADQRTLEQLNIQVVRVRESSSRIGEGHDHSSFKGENIKGSVLGRHRVSAMRHAVATVSDQSPIHMYTYLYTVGLKIVSNDGDNPRSDPKQDSVDGPAILEISAVFEAEYTSEEEVESSELEKFANKNVGYHVWPYWREFVQSSLARLELPADMINVPFYFAAGGEAQ